MAHTKIYDRIAPKVAYLRRTRPRQDAAAMLGMSESSLRRIEAKAKRDAAMPAWTAGLELRTANLLLAAGLNGKDQVRAAIEQRRNIPWIKALRLQIVREWLG